jgi:hypothetical protein
LFFVWREGPRELLDRTGRGYLFRFFLAITPAERRRAPADNDFDLEHFAVVRSRLADDTVGGRRPAASLQQFLQVGFVVRLA